MQTNIIHHINNGRKLLNRLRDIRFIGQIVFVIIVLLISWSGVKAIQTNYGLQKQIATLNQQEAIQKLQNINVGLQNQYYNSNQYLELSARQNLGLSAPGETELLVPQSVAMNYTAKVPTSISTQTVQSKNHQPIYQRNFEAWVNFFLHRQSNTTD